MALGATTKNAESRSTSRRVKPTLALKVVVDGAWGRALPAPKPGEKK
jgi:hypothetical protein